MRFDNYNYYNTIANYGGLIYVYNNNSIFIKTFLSKISIVLKISQVYPFLGGLGGYIFSFENNTFVIENGNMFDIKSEKYGSFI